MIAVDTNVLVYSVDTGEPERMQRATALLKSLEQADTILVWQVVCEFAATMYRNRAKLNVDIVPLLGMWMGVFRVVMPPRDLVTKAWKLSARYQLSYWDAQLLAACIDAGVTRLYTEDMQSAPTIESVQLVNPFA
jgi:predicted nucleic acid-binding protein